MIFGSKIDAKMDYVKLISKEGHAFYVARECAMQSAVIEASLRNDGLHLKVFCAIFT